jgi:hypothetical protein
MASVTADQTMHNQLLKIQELRALLQEKNKIIDELKKKLEFDMTCQTNQIQIDNLKHSLMLKDDVINKLKSSLESAHELLQFAYTDDRKKIVHTCPEGSILI